MQKINFKNKPNERIIANDSTFWISRSCAVVSEVLIFNEDSKSWYVLLNKRGPKTPDFQGFWSLPCGYLDWNETVQEAALREVYEECGIYLPNLNKHEGFINSHCEFLATDEFLTSDNSNWNNKQPWRVFSNPTGRQNISMHFSTLLYWKDNNFPTLSFEHCEEGEVEEVIWMKLEDAINLKLAFNHQDILRELLTYL